MTCKELITYLSEFDADEKVSIVVVDIEKRLRYKITGYQLLGDAGVPAILLEAGETRPMDEVLEEMGESEGDE